MWGTASIKDLCAKAKTYGYQRLALTDTDNLCGMWNFIKECRLQGLKPVIGAEITDPHTLSHRAVCLVKNSSGYSNITRLITCRHRDTKFSLKTFLPGFSKGLVVLTSNYDLLPFWHENHVDLGVNLVRHPLSQQHPLCVTARKLDIPLVATNDVHYINQDDAPAHDLLLCIGTNSSVRNRACRGSPAYSSSRCDELVRATISGAISLRWIKLSSTARRLE